MKVKKLLNLNMKMIVTRKENKRKEKGGSNGHNDSDVTTIGRNEIIIRLRNSL
jgi:hypothetical protein